MHLKLPIHSSQRVIVGLSGGVDSAIAAHRLLEQGYAVEALFMKNWEEDDAEGYCAAAEDLADARAVAERLGIRLHTVNFSAEYWDRVFEYFLHEYRALRTPNPDVLCNKEIKFAAFLDHALGLGAETIATGHYARVVADERGYHLHRGIDEDKDQTYFLHLLDQEQLSRARFPLADLSKSEVRTLAHRLGLANADKKDSTGICFIGERRFSDFLARYLPREPGPIETPEGVPLGEHRGLAYYTIGQRQGLGIGGVSQGREAPWYVAVKDSVNNRLIVVQDSRHPLLMSSGLEALQPHWISGQTPKPPFRCLARLRHRQPLQPCTLIAVGADGCRVRFDEPQRAVTPGQSIVFYQGTECLGGAVIERAFTTPSGG
ncbi:tRNA 2-thiouridine(34) synthase MnmA [Allochromatium palmeri]|uniref:tRNA-specific 2-thiouridylase MnmA n=1 Tax=Allochromatium palmeri TaxID=231048 RepID=A0A6N8EEJ7_9GAMM|nr:tRNA 2-thiouridine(34) synthase MnmA [Allochromatium palmeri]MTW22081.1 tRNA 2-thiouridine(34) synthase MnmA [Allochromatium palmeri]